MHEMIGHRKPRFGGSKAYETGLCTNETVTRFYRQTFIAKFRMVFFKNPWSSLALHVCIYRILGDIDKATPIPIVY